MILTRMRPIFAFILLALGSCRPAHEDRSATSSPDALRWPPLPAGYAEEGGMLMEAPDGGEYGVGYVRGAGGPEVWLSRLVARDGAGRPQWERRAVLPLPRLEAGESVVDVDCSYRGAPDASIIAIGRWTTTDTVADIRAAWRPNALRTGFDALPHREVSCGFDEDRS